MPFTVMGRDFGSFQRASLPRRLMSWMLMSSRDSRMMLQTVPPAPSVENSQPSAEKQMSSFMPPEAVRLMSVPLSSYNRSAYLTRKSQYFCTVGKNPSLNRA